MTTEVSAEQSLKADFPMDVTDSGIVTEVSAEQKLKEDSPIDVTEAVIVLYLNILHADMQCP